MVIFCEVVVPTPIEPTYSAPEATAWHYYGRKCSIISDEDATFNFCCRMIGFVHHKEKSRYQKCRIVLKINTTYSVCLKKQQFLHSSTNNIYSKPPIDLGLKQFPGRFPKGPIRNTAFSWCHLEVWKPVLLEYPSKCCLHM